MNVKFTDADEKQIAVRGISKSIIEDQIEKFRIGANPIELIRPASVGDGIVQLSNEEKIRFRKLFEAYPESISKFVPASGAATRMFKKLIEFRKRYTGSETEYNTFIENRKNAVFKFFKNLELFAFYDDLKNSFQKIHGISLEEAHVKREYLKILKALLEEPGLNYQYLPKGLLLFHRYDNECRTAAMEQVVEMQGFAPLGSHCHFTVSSEHMDHFKDHMDTIERKIAGTIRCSLSVQEITTDIIAVDEFNEPFRNEMGQLIFRPAGHGALLNNLNRMDGDLVFIKNIDNILPDRFKAESIEYKRLLGGIFLEYQSKVFSLLRREANGEDIETEGWQLLSEMGVSGKGPGINVSELLNRPIRICGMVRNAGEPGGGPFWVSGKNGLHTLQIIESAQVDKEDFDQKNTFEQSTHFNPVDMVCGLKDFNGEKFDLKKFRDNDQGFITTKSFEGRELKAMEYPGLWNGGMAHWNSVFVEVPLATFNPVKTVNDLLKPEHQAS